MQLRKIIIAAIPNSFVRYVHFIYMTFSVWVKCLCFYVCPSIPYLYFLTVSHPSRPLFPRPFPPFLSPSPVILMCKTNG